MDLVIATTDLHKVRKFRFMLREYAGVDILSLRDFSSYTPCSEVGKGLEENAKLTALHIAKQLNKVVLACESALVVPSLNGEPGNLSSSYAGDNKNDADNRLKLISKLKALSEEKRVGFLECSIAIATPEGVKKTASGTVEGQLLLEPKGSGYEYDPLFLKYDYSKTFGELDEETLCRISHIRKALDKLEIVLDSLLK